MHFAYIHFEAVGTDAWINNFNDPLELDYSRNTNFFLVLYFIGKDGTKKPR